MSALASGVVRAPTELDGPTVSALLHRAGTLDPDATIATVTATPIGTGQMADTIRLELTYGRGEGPTSLVAKLASADERSRGTGLALRAYEVEVRFYQHIAPTTAMRVPAAYCADVDVEQGWFTLILEDAAGRVQGDDIAGCDATVAAAALEELARLHAGCWERPDLAGLEWINRDLPERRQFLASLIASLVGLWRERFGDRVPPVLLDVATAAAPRWLSLGEHPAPRTVTHGDYRLDNMLFAPGDPCPLVVDWQTASWNPPAADVAYFLAGSLTGDDRRAHEADLLAHYHRALVAGGVEGYSLEQLTTDVAISSYVGVFMSVVASMLVAQTERGDEMFTTLYQRYAQHVLDVDGARFLRG